MSAVVVLGAGGHAKVVADVALLLGHEVLAYVDERGAASSGEIHGVPVVGTVGTHAEALIALGIGDNRARLRRYAELTGEGRCVATLVHPAAILARHVSLGVGTVVMAGVVVNTDTTVGAAAVLNTGSSVDHDCTVGDGVHVAPGSRVAGGVRLGDGAFLGIGAVVVPGRTVGAWAVVGAGAAVVRDVPDGRTVKGVPAR